MYVLRLLTQIHYVVNALTIKTINSGTSVIKEITLEPADNYRLASLCGQFDQNLKQIENHLAVRITYRGHVFKVSAEQAEGNGHDAANAAAAEKAHAAIEIIRHLYRETED